MRRDKTITRTPHDLFHRLCLNFCYGVNNLNCAVKDKGSMSARSFAPNIVSVCILQREKCGGLLVNTKECSQNRNSISHYVNCANLTIFNLKNKSRPIQEKVVSTLSWGSRASDEWFTHRANDECETRFRKMRKRLRRDEIHSPLCGGCASGVKAPLQGRRPGSAIRSSAPAAGCAACTPLRSHQARRTRSTPPATRLSAFCFCSRLLEPQSIVGPPGGSARAAPTTPPPPTTPCTKSTTCCEFQIRDADK